jgi:uncharacterized protein YjiS (DUF1127 family)
MKWHACNGNPVMTASSALTTAAAFPRRVGDALASALTVAKRGAADWRRRSRQRREFLSFRLADIEDIGASELDVWREINKPFWQS